MPWYVPGAGFVSSAPPAKVRVTGTKFSGELLMTGGGTDDLGEDYILDDNGEKVIVGILIKNERLEDV